MEALLFIGIQASGKTTFYQQRFFRTHMHISLDLLRTRHRERQFLETCFRTQMRFVVDNTNPTAQDRARYIPWAKQHQYKVIGYFFETELEAALQRNAARPGKQNIPEVAVRACYNKLEVPKWEEGFDELYRVRMEKQGFSICTFA